MVKLALVVEGRPGLLATSVYPLPAALTDRLLKVAMPFSGLAVSVPARPLPPIRAIVTGLVAAGTIFPLVSSTTTWTAGEIVAPVRAADGCCKNANFVGKGAVPVGALMVKLMLVVEARLGPLATSVYPLPAVFTVRLLKVATPFRGAAVNVPARLVPPVSESVTGSAAVVTTFPVLSSTAT
jgi:hypothetical protein